MLPTAHIQCPYCGESIEIALDTGTAEDPAGSQRYIEDCQVCCRPIDVRIDIDADGDPVLSVSAEDDV